MDFEDKDFNFSKLEVVDKLITKISDYLILIQQNQIFESVERAQFFSTMAYCLQTL